MVLANDLIEKTEMYRWLKEDEHQEIFDILTDGYLYRILEGKEQQYG